MATRATAPKKITPAVTAQFLEALAATGSVTAAAERTKIERRRWYAARKATPSLASAWAEAAEIGREALEDEAVRRAAKGTLKPIFRGGTRIGHVRDYSDQLLMFLLRERKGERGEPSEPEPTDAAASARAKLEARLGSRTARSTGASRTQTRK